MHTQQFNTIHSLHPIHASHKIEPNMSNPAQTGMGAQFSGMDGLLQSRRDAP